MVNCLGPGREQYKLLVPIGIFSRICPGGGSGIVWIIWDTSLSIGRDRLCIVIIIVTRLYWRFSRNIVADDHRYKGYRALAEDALNLLYISLRDSLNNEKKG